MATLLVTDQNFGDDAAMERRLAADAGVELAVEQCADEQAVVDAVERHRPQVLLVQFAPVGERALAGDGLTGVVRCGIGVDNVDLDAATARGIAVARVPDYCIDEVADHTLALLLAVERGVVDLAAQTRDGGWDYRAAGAVRRLRGLTLGLVGFGRIARAVAERAAGFGLRVAAHDPAVADDDVRAARATPLALDVLLRTSHVVSLHVPLTEETRHLLGERELAVLRDDAVVLNTSRGGLVDECALAEALESGRLRGAGVDVLEAEPAPADHPLRRAPRCVLTPHAAWFSGIAVTELREKAFSAAVALLHGERPAELVVG